MREPGEFVNEMQDDARFLPADHTLAMVVEDQDCLHFLHHNQESLVSQLSELMKNGCIPLGLIRASPSHVALTRTGATVQKTCGYRCFRECGQSAGKDRILMDAVVDFARESFKKIQLLGNNKWVILVSKSNPALGSDGYFEIALYLTDRDDFIPPGSPPDKPGGSRLRDRE